MKRELRDAAETLLRTAVNEALHGLKKPVTRTARRAAKEIDKLARKANGAVPILKGAVDLIEFSSAVGYEKLIKEHAAQFCEGLKGQLADHASSVLLELVRPKRKR